MHLSHYYKNVIGIDLGLLPFDELISPDGFSIEVPVSLRMSKQRLAKEFLDHYTAEEIIKKVQEGLEILTEHDDHNNPNPLNLPSSGSNLKNEQQKKSDQSCINRLLGDLTLYDIELKDVLNTQEDWHYSINPKASEIILQKLGFIQKMTPLD